MNLQRGVQKALILFSVVCGTFAFSPADACTVFRLRAADGTVMTGRAMEFGVDLNYDIVVVPRGKDVVSPTPDGRAGAAWKTRHGYVGVAQFGLEYGLTEGMNEKGLAVSGLWFEADMKWQEFDAAVRDRSIGGPLVVDWLLGNVGSVAEIEAGLKGLRVVPFCLPEKKFCPTLHFNACDAGGGCKVIEFEDGALRVYENPLGIMTNAPRFPWHMDNLRQYIGLQNYNPAAVKQSGVAFPPTGHGAGMWGMPGDLTPPSRFVRLAVITKFADPQPDAAGVLNLAQHIINDFDIVRGMVVEPPP